MISDYTFLVRNSNGDSYYVYFDIENQIFYMDDASSFLSELDIFFFSFININNNSGNFYYYYSMDDTQSNLNNPIYSFIETYLRFEIEICLNSDIYSGIENYITNFLSAKSISSIEGENLSIKTSSSSFDKIEIYKNFERNTKLWVQCDNCYETHYKKFFKSKMNICEYCGYHLKMSSSDRIELFIDPGTWEPMDEDMVYMDPEDMLSMDPEDMLSMDPEYMVYMDPAEDMVYMDPEDMLSMDPAEDMVYMDPAEDMLSMDPAEDMLSMDPEDMVSMDPAEDMLSMDPAEDMLSMDPAEDMLSMDPEDMVSMDPEYMVSMDPAEDMVSMDPEYMVSMDPAEDMVSMDPAEDMVSMDPIEIHSEEESYRDRIYFYQINTGLTDAVQTGVGRLNSIPVAIGIMDFQFMGGSMGSVVGEKITRLIEYATNRSLPVIIVCASGGARMQEGSLSLMQMAKISSASYDYQSNKKLFYVSILTSPTTGGVTASFGMLGDIIIAEPNAYIAFAGKRVIEQTLKTTVPEGSQEAEYSFPKGLFDPIVPRNPLKGVLNELFQLHGFLPLNQG
nr:acetyl-CoA carboxylase carboxyltransferase beta subunit [Malaxis monophyllos]WNR49320.1 acetyl-CoA carboxylase carboxyltransferase beta subunit [Malaxis monophyllos]